MVRTTRYALPGLAVALLALTFASPALGQERHVYWANEAGSTIGRANIDGTAVNQGFITGAPSPHAVTVGGTRLYWAHGNTPGFIGLGKRDGSAVNHRLIAAGRSPRGVALDGKGLFWTHVLGGAGKVGRARPNGARPNPAATPTGPSPCGVAADGDRILWANGGNPGTIGSEHSDELSQFFIVGAQEPCGVAMTNTHIYWANRTGNSIGRSNLDGRRSEQAFIPATSPCGVAADDTYVYWSNATGTIGRARIDGSGVEQSFITGAQGPCGVAVDPRLVPAPAALSFANARPRRATAIQALVLTNTSSSAAAVFRATFTGTHAGDFQKTGDSCLVGVIAAGRGCVINARFRPRARGRRSAVLRVESNAGAPVEIPVSGRGDARRPRVRRVRVVGGRTLSYSLSENARVRVTIAKRGEKGRLRRVRAFRQRGKKGRNRRRLRSRLGAGSYRATFRARDAAGNRSKRRVVRFRVAPRG